MVQYTEAFNYLGYDLENPRQDWSAEKGDGVCITIWQKERSVEKGLPYLDLWELHPKGGLWMSKPGHNKRTKHLMRAINEFDGRVDVIFVEGNPGISYKNAAPWDVAMKKGRYWHISKFDPANGYFRAEIHPDIASKDAGK